MKGSQLLPLFRSQTQADLLALLFLNPEKEFSMTDVSKLIGVSLPGVHHEVVRLVKAGYINDRRQGNSRMISAQKDSLIAQPLADLLTVTHGPLPVLAEELSGIRGIESAYIFGSWASRYSGAAGPIPKDIDVLVVGTTDLDDLDVAAQRAQKKLLREVNVRRVTSKDWMATLGANESDVASNAFLTTVRLNPIVEIPLSKNLL